MLSLDLAQAVRKQFTNPHRRQRLIELLGSQFKRSYLAEEQDTPQILVTWWDVYLNRTIKWKILTFSYQAASEYDRRAEKKAGEWSQIMAANSNKRNRY